MTETATTDGTEVPATPLARRLQLVATIAFYAVSIAYFAYLFRYYMTGAGGPSLLAVTAVPMSMVIVVLEDLRSGRFYPRLGTVGPHLVALAYIAFCAYAAYYLVSEFDNIRIYRIGVWNAHDLAVGGLMAALVLEYTRRRYFILFVLNVALILYTVYGYVVPGLFNHPGMPWTRVLSAVSVEMSTGIFERLSQLALTLVGSFILVLAALRAFGCIESILTGSSHIAKRSPRLLPQAAVVGSFGVAAVSGSGAANAATTGSATIPVLVKAGFPRATAAAVETASSLGGQLMPPLMGIAAFLMAEYLGQSYFEVVARGFAPAIIYFVGVAFAVYLLATKYHRRAVVPDVEPMTLADKLNIVAYLLSVVGLIYYMGVARRPAMASAHSVFMILLAILTVMFLARMAWQREFSLKKLVRPFLDLVESFATITAGLTILLATLGILTATFTITGVPTKVGVLLMEGAGINMLAMALVAFGFGYLVGMGLPVSPTYIVTAVVIAPFMIRAGLDPWVVHFFAFFVAVFGELSPPTSVVAAVTSRIANASFMRTMFSALILCMPLMVMMAAIFTRPDLVTVPGWSQLPAFLLVLTGTVGLSLAFQAHLHENRPADIALRTALASLCGVVIFYPDYRIAGIVAVAVAGLVAWGLHRFHRIVPGLEEVPEGK
ncbi:TRAP transporter permease [Kaustia mangrovi]|uniref:TRAP transporter permease n=1 Tax=Kaustia mangrovi TaxID=2593653 RepID=A0A7S8C5K7_9HYPH|nr:TRAP transporter fused permease subunit [Kaustia mangrovi]QPC43793.1 TRAP transporter permease [Kaustia mangrovi]